MHTALVLLFMCCHPVLSSSSAIALTLRAVGGSTTFEIAKAFLVPEATMAQRISRAKQRIQASGLLQRMSDNPMVTLSHAIATAAELSSDARGTAA